MSQTQRHELYLQRALDLALGHLRRTSPNPKVGCIIVQDDEIIAEGVTTPVGGPHAEVVALTQAGERARGATLYVTLEPCCHYGRTPPCTDAIIQAGIERVVIGARDLNPLVDGGGVAALRASGIDVVTGLLGPECQRAYAPFFHYIQQGQPWVILKAAITLDGQIATQSGDSKWITSEPARADVHRTRARVDAVMVGGETARLDNPRLTVRLSEGSDPLRVILDSHLNVPVDAAWSGNGTVIYCADDAPKSRRTALIEAGNTIVPVQRADVGLDLNAVMDDLASKGVVTLLVEGGGTLHGQLLTQRLAQAAQIYIAPRLLGRGRPLLNIPGPNRIADAWSLSQLSVRQVGMDVCIEGRLAYEHADPDDADTV